MRCILLSSLKPSKGVLCPLFFNK